MATQRSRTRWPRQRRADAGRCKTRSCPRLRAARAVRRLCARPLISATLNRSKSVPREHLAEQQACMSLWLVADRTLTPRGYVLTPSEARPPARAAMPENVAFREARGALGYVWSHSRVRLVMSVLQNRATSLNPRHRPPGTSLDATRDTSGRVSRWSASAPAAPRLWPTP